jgi:hypothetical protein
MSWLRHAPITLRGALARCAQITITSAMISATSNRPPSPPRWLPPRRGVKPRTTLPRRVIPNPERQGMLVLHEKIIRPEYRNRTLTGPCLANDTKGQPFLEACIA